MPWLGHEAKRLASTAVSGEANVGIDRGLVQAVAAEAEDNVTRPKPRQRYFSLDSGHDYSGSMS